MPVNDTSSRPDMMAGSVATVLTSIRAVYGLWVAFSYGGGTADLVPSVIAAYVSAVCAAFGLRRRSRFVTDFGLLLATFTPVGPTWIFSAASLFVGAASFFREILKHRKRKR